MKKKKKKKHQGERKLTFGYCLTGMRTRSLSLMFFVVKRSRYVSASFLVSPFWILSISKKGEVFFQAERSCNQPGFQSDKAHYNHEVDLCALTAAILVIYS